MQGKPQADPAPRRGRPPRLSRAQIVEAVAQMLLDDPSTPLTVARAAEAVGAKPMSLYRHFRDRDDLVAAVARHLFAGTRPPVEPGEPWQSAVSSWMVAVYRQARRTPQILQLLASGESVEWLGDSAYLVAIFERAGVGDDRTLAEAVYFVATATMGQAMIHAAGSGQLRPERLGASLSRLAEEDQGRVARLIPQFDRFPDAGFDLVVQLTIAGLEHLLSLPGS